MMTGFMLFTVPQVLGLPFGCFSCPSQFGRSRLDTGTSMWPTSMVLDADSWCCTVSRSGRSRSPLHRRAMLMVIVGHIGLAPLGAVGVRATST